MRETSWSTVLSSVSLQPLWSCAKLFDCLTDPLEVRWRLLLSPWLPPPLRCYPDAGFMNMHALSHTHTIHTHPLFAAWACKNHCTILPNVQEQEVVLCAYASTMWYRIAFIRPFILFLSVLSVTSFCHSLHLFLSPLSFPLSVSPTLWKKKVVHLKAQERCSRQNEISPKWTINEFLVAR